MAFPTCPDIASSPTAAALYDLGAKWAVDPLRPRVSSDTLESWDSLIAEWITRTDLPLLIRKFKDNRGSIQIGKNSRKLIPTDNTPAQWAFAVAFDGFCPTVSDLIPMLEDGRLPLAMAFSSPERQSAVYRGTRGKCPGTADGWKLAHLSGIGIGSRLTLGELDPEVITKHFRGFMSPRNMMVVPAVWSGLAEVPEFLRGFTSVVAS